MSYDTMMNNHLINWLLVIFIEPFVYVQAYTNVSDFYQVAFRSDVPCIDFETKLQQVFDKCIVLLYLILCLANTHCGGE